jgi:hypothetical protein
MGSSSSNRLEGREAVLLGRYRWMLGFFIAGLVVSGVTAFPLLLELRLLTQWLGVDATSDPALQNGLVGWVLRVRMGLEKVYGEFPWIAYGTDWLAFGHCVIALFFVGPWRKPVENAWVLKVGLVACVLVIPLALICGPIRGIPLGWRLLDCSFGVFGAIPLLCCLKWTREMAKLR